jgi:hypothetical protein
MIQSGLIVGTSHAAALRLAWRAFATQWPRMNLAFAAMQGDMADFLVAGPHLTARPGAPRDKLHLLSGQADFDLTAYDFVALCGGTASTFHATRLYALARWPGLPSVLANPMSKPNVSLLSSRCFEEALAGIIRGGPAFSLLNQIRSVTAARVFAIPHPALSADVLRQSKQHQGFVQIHRAGDAAALARMLNSAAARACGDQATHVPPPAQLRQDHFFTDPQFRRGATRLGQTDTVPQPPDDLLHGNADYGRHILTGLHALL